jgi:hypothetical protein
MAKQIEQRPHLQIKLDAAQRWLMWHFFSKKAPHFLVTEYPRSGGSWVAQMVAAYLDIPFPRDQRPEKFRKSCVLHGHQQFNAHFGNVFCVMRDGRDVMVSAYHHFLFPHDRSLDWATEKYRRALPFSEYEDIRRNLPAFIEFMFKGQGRKRINFTWSEFALSWIDKAEYFVKYEDLLKDCYGVLGDALGRVTGDTLDKDKLALVVRYYSFEKMTGRKAGDEQEGQFIRKGIAGDWKNVFSQEACDVFHRYAGDVLIALGYEKDASWKSIPGDNSY